MEFEVQDTDRDKRTGSYSGRLVPLVAAVVFAIGGLALLPAPLSSTAPVPSEESLSDLDTPFLDFASPDEVAESFMDAWVRGDGEAAASLFRPGARFNGVELETFPTLHEWYRAVGQEYRGQGCELQAGSSTVVSCDYLYSNKLTRHDDVRPISIRHLVFVEDGAIQGVIEMSSAFNEFWGFTEWVSTNHPDDFELLFRFGPNPTNTNYPLLDPTAIALWEQYSNEFVASTSDPEAEYYGQVREICTAAHARLNQELQAAGIELQLPNGPGIDRLYLLPAREADWVPYEAAARRIMGETLPELRALRPPPEIREKFQRLYAVMKEFAQGEEAPFTPTAEFWIHRVDLEPSRSLSHCTFALGA